MQRRFRNRSKFHFRQGNLTNKEIFTVTYQAEGSGCGSSTTTLIRLSTYGPIYETRHKTFSGRGFYALLCSLSQFLILTVKGAFSSRLIIPILLYHELTSYIHSPLPFSRVSLLFVTTDCPFNHWFVRNTVPSSPLMNKHTLGTSDPESVWRSGCQTHSICRRRDLRSLPCEQPNLREPGFRCKTSQKSASMLLFT